jgi:uncharacterized protein YceK
MRRLALILAASAVLAGCATTHTSSELTSGAHSTAPTCTAGPDCEAKWKAAKLWVAENISFPMVQSGNLLIETEGPSRDELFCGACGRTLRLAATVRREADPSDPQRFRIVAEIGCGNPFNCRPTWQEALADFNRTVSAARSP